MKRSIFALCLSCSLFLHASPSLADGSVAYAHYNQGKYEQAHRSFLELAQRGFPVYQNMVADMYRKGLGVEEDQGLAYVWYSLSAGQGNRKAIALKERIGCKLDEAERSRLNQLTKEYAEKYVEPYIQVWSLAENQ